MLSSWTDRFTRVLSTHLKRGALLVLAVVTTVSLTLSPVFSTTSHAAGITDLLGAGGSLTDGLSSCAIETVGWVICPTMRSIARLADYGFTYINQNFLRIDYDIASSTSGTYKAWELMRNVANALFVVAFMVLVYSQLTGRGGGYSMKRLVPKLLIVAIGVNVSYYVCVFLVDVTNIVGDALITVLKDVAAQVGNSVMPIGAAPAAFQDGTLTTITTSVMSKTGVAWVLLAPVAAVTISIATISAAGLVILIMRKTVIAMLILGSPILLVAFLLPNLERFFAQSARLFGQLLLIYPICAMLLGAGQIVSATIVTVGSNDANYRVSGDSYSAKNGGSGSAITDLTAAAAAVMPLLGVWFVFKNMSSVMSTAGSRLSASVAGRRGGKDDANAKVTGNATAGAAKSATAGLGGQFNRRQAFSRNKRKSSLGGSSLDNEGAGQANRPSAGAAAQNALQNGLPPQGGDSRAQLEGLGEAKVSGSAEADGSNLAGAMTDAIAQGNAKAEENKKLTAKDLFANLNKSSHDSKDKDRKFSSGPAPAGGGGGSGGGSGTPQPSGPSTSYNAPQIAQNGNIVTGSAPQQTTKIIAVPVQIDASALLGQQQQNHPPDNMAQPPISGTEAKAKARAQKYTYDSQRDIDEARDKLEILGHNSAPIEPPHTDTHTDDKDKPKSDEH
ncbi:MAG: rane protein of unknown function [Candidatus Saccharibacteria bacterium]|nr:rane protein of unknown function [Candidatus Saccharibacteria bacterium]